MSFITLSEAKDMVKTYQDNRSSVLASGYSTDVLPLNITFDKEEVLRLLDQTGCTQLRAYFGMKSEDLIDLVLVAADKDDADIIPNEEYLLIDHGKRCPYNCPPASVLTP